MNPTTDILTPCHGVAPVVDLDWYSDWRGFFCPVDGCCNDWDKNGKAASYNK